MKYFVGIDFGKFTHSICIIDANGVTLKKFQIQNKMEGFERFKKEIEGLSNVSIAFEPGDGLFIDYLSQLSHPLFSINALQIKRYKQSIRVAGNKTDTVDAEALAYFLKTHGNKIHPMSFSSPEVKTLGHLVRAHDSMTKHHTALILRFRDKIGRYFPLLNTLFTSSAPKILCKMVLKYPTWGDLSQESEENLIQFLKENHYRNRKYIARVLKMIQEYRHCVLPEVEQGVSMEVRFLAESILLLQEQLKSIAQEMEKIIQKHSLGKVFLSLPGVGTILASKLLSAIGDDKERFKNKDSLRAYLGTAPVNFQSGRYHRVRFRRACNKPGREAMYQLAFCSLQCSSWAREYYDKQRSLGKRHSVAIRALSNKWAAIVFALWKNGRQYDSALREKKAG